MFRRRFLNLKSVVRNKNIVLVVLILVALLAALPSGWFLAKIVGKDIMGKVAPYEDARQMNYSRNLRKYINNIKLLVEPYSTPCSDVSEVPLLVLVESPPYHESYREVARMTWAMEIPTYFVLGVEEYALNYPDESNLLENNYIESKANNDLVIFDFIDSVSNRTLKTALMLHWALNRCPQVEFLFKTCDDVLVNPLALRHVVKDNPDAELIGYRAQDGSFQRRKSEKYLVNKWQRRENDFQYLSGTGYLINGAYLTKILSATRKVPMEDVEDVYFTYFVARKALGFKLTHDRRLDPRRPWMPFICAYWDRAVVHDLGPVETIEIWPKIWKLNNEYNQNSEVCTVYQALFSTNLLSH